MAHVREGRGSHRDDIRGRQELGDIGRGRRAEGFGEGLGAVKINVEDAGEIDATQACVLLGVIAAEDSGPDHAGAQIRAHGASPSMTAGRRATANERRSGR